MLSLDTDNRPTVKDSLGKFWTLYQLSKSVGKSRRIFQKDFALLNQYLTQIRVIKDEWDQLSLDDSWTLEVAIQTNKKEHIMPSVLDILLV
jgi:hypothetical protein